MTKKASTPALRFKGFTYTWEQRKLGEVGETYTGLSGKTKDDFGHGNGKFVTYMNVFTNTVGLSDMTEAVEIDDSQNKVRFGDVLFTTSSETPEEVGMSSVWLGSSENIYLNSFCFGYRPTINFDLYYLAYMLRSSSMRKKITFLAQGISRYNISKNKMMDIEIPIPPIEEQKQIGSYFRNLDRLITLHQRKYDKLTNMKKSMLEKMFPNNGANVPEIRFKGFTDAWEQRKLKEVVNVYDGVHQTPDYKDSGVMFLSVENISILKSEKYISEEAFQKDYKVYPQKGDVLMTRIGDVGTPNVVETTEKVAFYVSLALLKPTKINSYFLCNSIQSPLFQKGLKDRTLVTAIPQKINKDEIGKVNIILPASSQEQQLIGEYFRNLDRLITLHQRELEKLKNLKKACLEKMFV